MRIVVCADTQLGNEAEFDLSDDVVNMLEEAGIFWNSWNMEPLNEMFTRLGFSLVEMENRYSYFLRMPGGKEVYEECLGLLETLIDTINTDRYLLLVVEEEVK